MSKKRIKRETTRWLYRVSYLGGGSIKVGRVFNGQRVPEDVVRYQVNSPDDPDASGDFSCTVDEAAALAAGLNIVVSNELAHKSEGARKMFR